MDREVIEQKLESLRRCIERLKTKYPLDSAALATDFDLQDIISLNLSRAIQISVDIGAHLIASTEASPPRTMGQTFDLLAQKGVLNDELASNLKKVVGFRNIVVHNYESINWAIVHSIIKYHLVDFEAFAGIISLKLKA